MNAGGAGFWGAVWFTLRDRLGLDAGLDTPVEEMSVVTCLQHEEQALLYLPRDLPAVDSPDFIDEAAARIATLVRLTPGGTFVLCTSLRAMKGLSAALRPQLDTPVFVQGELPKTALLEAFKGTEDATLVASMSFWEGVDVPGPALRLVIIDRIPFPVPSDPLVVARGRGVEARGKSAFMHYHLPQAALTLKQGFGRLLRARTDFGVVAVLDGRIQSRGYGSVLKRSIPPAAQSDDLAEVKRFFARASRLARTT